MSVSYKKWLGLSFGFLVGSYLISLVWLATAVHTDTKRPSDVVIVLGAKAKWGERINPCLEARVNQGVELIKKDFAKTLIVSGGVDQEDGTIEAGTMKALAIQKGLQSEQIILESNATSTYENLAFSQNVMAEKGYTSAIVVSEPFHLPRAALVARELGMDTTVSPAYGSPCWERWKYLSRYFLKEPMNVAWYWVTGKI